MFTPKNMQRIHTYSFLALVFTICGLLCTFSATFAQTTDPIVSWAAITNINETDKQFDYAVPSRDGTHVLAVDSSDRIYISRNGGTSWEVGNEVYTLAEPAISESGQYMAIQISGNKMHQSSDYGVTWESQNLPFYTFSGADIAMSDDGTTLLSLGRSTNQVPTDNRVYVSHDGGGTWAMQSVPDVPWGGVAMSADGQTLLVSSITSTLNPIGYVYISTNGGQTWQQRHAGYWYYMRSADMSADGQTIAVVDTVGWDHYNTYPDNMWVSTNGGLNWSAKPLSGSLRDVSVSSDGAKMIAATSYPYYGFHTTTNSGTSWTFHSDSDTASSKITLSGDAGLAISGGNAKLSTDFGSTWSSITAPLPPQLWRSARLGGDTIVGNNAQNLYISTDAGLSWTKEDEFRPNSHLGVSDDGSSIITTIPYLGYQHPFNRGVYTSINAGTSWSPVSDQNMQYRGTEFRTIGNAFTHLMYHGVGANSGAGISHDGGITWPYYSAIYQGDDIAFANGGQIVAAATDNGLLLSTNGGSYAPEVYSGRTTAVAMSTDGQTIVANHTGSYPTKTIVSTDGGSNWNEYPHSSYLSFSRFECSDDCSTLVGKTSSNVYVSTDTGQTWHLQTASGTQGYITDLDITADGSTILLASYGEYSGGYPGAFLQKGQISNCSIALDPNPIAPGGSSTLTFECTGADWVHIENVGYVGTEGSFVVSPTETTDYTVTIGTSSGQHEFPAELLVENNVPAAPTVSNSACIMGEEYTLSVQSADPDGHDVRYHIDWDNNGAVDEIVPATSFVASNTLQNATSTGSLPSFTVRVLADDEYTSFSNETLHIVTCAQKPNIPAITPDASCRAGQSFNVGVQGGHPDTGASIAYHLTLSGASSDSVRLPSSGFVSPNTLLTHTVTPTDGTLNGSAYTVDDAGATSGTQVMDPVTCTSAPPCPVCVDPGSDDPSISIDAEPQFIQAGTQATLTWVLSGIDIFEDCSITGGSDSWGWSVISTQTSQLSSSIIGSTEYTLSCSLVDGGNMSDSVLIQMVPIWQEF